MLQITYAVSWLFLSLLLLSVFVVVSHIELMPYLYCYYTFVLSFPLSLSLSLSLSISLSRVHLLVRFWRSYIIFLGSRLSIMFRRVDRRTYLGSVVTPVSLVFLIWIVLFRYDGWYYWWISISYICFYLCAWLYMSTCVLSCSLLTA